MHNYIYYTTLVNVHTYVYTYIYAYIIVADVYISISQNYTLLYDF